MRVIATVDLLVPSSFNPFQRVPHYAYLDVQASIRFRLGANGIHHNNFVPTLSFTTTGSTLTSSSTQVVAAVGAESSTTLTNVTTGGFTTTGSMLTQPTLTQIPSPGEVKKLRQDTRAVAGGVAGVVGLIVLGLVLAPRFRWRRKRVISVQGEEQDSGQNTNQYWQGGVRFSDFSLLNTTRRLAPLVKRSSTVGNSSTWK